MIQVESNLFKQVPSDRYVAWFYSFTITNRASVNIFASQFEQRAIKSLICETV